MEPPERHEPPAGSLDVAACVARVRQGDDDAARVLMEHLFPLVVRLVRRHLPRRTSEEDLVQMTFIKMFANLEQYSGTVPLEHWVARITINTCLNQLQAEKIRPELRHADLSEEQATVIDALTASPDELHPAQSLAARELVELLLARLDPTERLILTLLHLEDRSVAEVQQLTGWNQSLIKIRAFRARHKLKKYLQQLTAGEPL